MYFSNPFFINPKAPTTTGIAVAYIPHILLISISRSLYFDSFSVTLTEVYLYKDAFLCCFVFDYNVWPISSDLSVGLYGHVP